MIPEIETEIAEMEIAAAIVEGHVIGEEKRMTMIMADFSEI